MSNSAVFFQHWKTRTGREDFAKHGPKGDDVSIIIDSYSRKYKLGKKRPN
jgi:hypothetical protein